MHVNIDHVNHLQLGCSDENLNNTVVLFIHQVAPTSHVAQAHQCFHTYMKLIRKLDLNVSEM